MTPSIKEQARKVRQEWEIHWSQCLTLPTQLAEEERDDGEEVESPAVGPFCGCDTCITRETIAGAWPVIEKYFEQRQNRPVLDL